MTVDENLVKYFGKRKHPIHNSNFICRIFYVKFLYIIDTCFVKFVNISRLVNVKFYINASMSEHTKLHTRNVN